MSLHKRLAAGALVIAVAAACGGGGSATGPAGGNNGSGGGPGGSCAANTICMLFSASSTYGATDPGNGSFSPATLTVARGSTVTFSNNSGVAHDVVFDAASPPGGDIGVISAGSQTRTFTTAGLYSFHCTIHAGMSGSVTVQ